MRVICLLSILLIFSGCAVKPKYALQTATSFEVGVSKETDQEYKLIDRNRRAISKAKVINKTLVFSLPSNTPKNVCYAVINEEKEPLFDEKAGFRITSISNYQQLIGQRNHIQTQYSTCERMKEVSFSNLKRADVLLDKNKLFNGKTCDLPPQKAIPPFPKTICGNYRQCQKLAEDSCRENLVAAESCGLALSKTNVHSSISSVSCGALLAKLNGRKYGIGSGVQDAITGYLDEHTKNMFQEEKYTEGIATFILRGVFTYLRTQSCEDDFTKAAYAPIERWRTTKDRIEREPYRVQKGCISLIHNYNSSHKEFNDNKACVENSGKQIVSLEKSIEKAKRMRSEPIACTF